MGPTRTDRLLLAIVVMLFAILLFLVGAGQATSFIVGVVGLLVGLSGVSPERPKGS